MSIEEIANRLAELCRKCEYLKAQDELFDDRAVNVEPKGAPVEVTEGLSAIKQKTRDWLSLIDTLHYSEVSKPVIAGNFFCCIQRIEVTYKGMPKSHAEEISIYEVKNEKIIKEQFFFDPEDAMV